MMQLLLPLGLLSLLGVIALIIIYIIKPNYQLKHVSSTHIWKLSLKYKKRRLPTSKLRDILLFILQALILVAMALILAKPAIVFESQGDANELIAVIDSSMSMYTSAQDGTTRFTRAVDKAIADCNSVFGAEGQVSVILADDSPEFLYQRESAENRSTVIRKLNELKGDEEGKVACSYGKSDLDKAMELSEAVLAQNPNAQVKIYTDKNYEYVPDDVTIVPVGEEDESEGAFNVAILDARADYDDGYYTLTVELACYGATRSVDLNVVVYGANAVDADEGGVDRPPITHTVFCDGDRTKTVIFRNGGGEETQDIFYHDLEATQRFYTFRSIEVFVDEEDSLKIDNSFYIYGGLKEVLKVQYASGDNSQVGANPFVNGVLPVMVDAFADRWDIKVTEVQKGAEPALTGFDFYIFEHTMPEALPTDGVVLLLDPSTAPIGSDIYVRRQVSLGSAYTTLKISEGAEDHPLLRNINAGSIQVSAYREIDHATDYKVLMTFGNGAPALIARNEKNSKTAVMGFSVHNSTFVMLPDWTLMWYNLFDYFLPSTVVGSTFEIGENIVVNGRGEKVIFENAQSMDDPEEITDFPHIIDSIETPGTYTFDVTTYFGKKAPTERIFVRPPREESNIFYVEEALTDPYAEKDIIQNYDDLLVYFAAALVGLLFVEWAIKSIQKS